VIPAPLPRSFFDRPTARVARELLGKVIVRRPEKGGPVRMARIVEAEAYLGERDQASHARRGPTPRAAIMFGPPGHLYCYLIYGMYVCANFVTERDGMAGAVLIRAAASLDDGDPKELRGPGKLCRGLGITLAHKGLDLTAGGPVFVADDGSPPPKRGRSPRIGVDYAGLWAARPLRFYVPGHPSVSGPRSVHSPRHRGDRRGAPPLRAATSRSMAENMAGREAATRASVTLRTMNPGRGALIVSETR
jgi:DNA-3-methyladenine glycosylase